MLTELHVGEVPLIMESKLKALNFNQLLQARLPIPVIFPLHM